MFWITIPSNKIVYSSVLLFSYLWNVNFELYLLIEKKAFFFSFFMCMPIFCSFIVHFFVYLWIFLWFTSYVYEKLCIWWLIANGYKWLSQKFFFFRKWQIFKMITLKWRKKNLFLALLNLKKKKKRTKSFFSFKFNIKFFFFFYMQSFIYFIFYFCNLIF